MKGWFGAFGGKTGAAAAVPPEAQGTYCCFVRDLTYWFGAQAGISEKLEGGVWELQVITPKLLLWEYQDANSVHNGQPIELDYRPAGLDQLVARQPGRGVILRIGLDPAAESTRFAGLGTHASFTGICFFKPAGT